MKKIGIDALGIESEGGARTSILQMAQYVTKACKDCEFIIYLSKPEPSLDSPNTKQIILPFRRGLLSRLFMQCFLPFDMIFRGIDLIHFTKSQSSFIPFKRKILTIHDLTILLHPEIHPKLSVLYWKHVQPLMVKHMDAIFTVSNNAANDIMNIYGVEREKVSVIYNKTQFDKVPEKDNYNFIKKKYNLPDKYFLYVGLLALKKNLITLIEAYSILTNSMAELPPLILVGPRYSISDASDVLNKVDDQKLDGLIKYLGKIPKNDLYFIFKNATMFLFPSFHEGFGIPCLEAMQLGVPLIASKASAIPEIVGQAGLLIDDYMSPDAWAEAIKGLFLNPEKRLSLSVKGNQRFNKIVQENSYTTVINVYQQVLNQQNK